MTGRTAATGKLFLSGVCGFLSGDFFGIVLSHQRIDNAFARTITCLFRIRGCVLPDFANLFVRLNFFNDVVEIIIVVFRVSGGKLVKV